MQPLQPSTYKLIKNSNYTILINVTRWDLNCNVGTSDFILMIPTWLCYKPKHVADSAGAVMYATAPSVKCYGQCSKVPVSVISLKKGMNMNILASLRLYSYVAEDWSVLENDTVSPGKCFPTFWGTAVASSPQVKQFKHTPLYLRKWLHWLRVDPGPLKERNQDQKLVLATHKRWPCRHAESCPTGTFRLT
jgi:hypothetical protein